MENPSPLTHIIVHNAYEHNLKNLNLSLPKNKLVVITGVSGSGKSTLAFDTIYAEGTKKVHRITKRLCKTISRYDG